MSRLQTNYCTLNIKIQHQKVTSEHDKRSEIGSKCNRKKKERKKAEVNVKPPFHNSMIILVQLINTNKMFSTTSSTQNMPTKTNTKLIRCQ